jgi:hypothetical protein
MPVKRRMAKRRVDPAAEVAAWDCMFDAGHDFFDDLRDIGVTAHHDRWADRVTIEAQRSELLELTEAAWHRLGHLFLIERKPDPHRTPWALGQFGEPHHAR